MQLHAFLTPALDGDCGFEVWHPRCVLLTMYNVNVYSVVNTTNEGLLYQWYAIDNQHPAKGAQHTQNNKIFLSGNTRTLFSTHLKL
jgi:hypothetical protein